MTAEQRFVNLTVDEKKVLELYHKAAGMKFAELEIQFQDSKMISAKLTEKFKLN